MYVTMKQMLEEIIKDHQYVHAKYLLLTKISLLGNGKAFIPEKRKYLNIYTGKFLTHTPRLIIEEFYIHNKLKYICNGRTFNSYQMALKYVMNEKRNNPIRYTRKPSSPILSQLEYTDWIKEKVYCRKFWMTLWGTCDYYCYSKKNFRVMIEKFLLEINYYREKYGAGKLVESKKLFTAALNYLREIVSLGSVIDITKFEDVEKASLAKAPLIMNHWFGEHKNYKWNTRFGSTETRHFTAMVWKSVSKIGIGVVQLGNYIYVKVIYDKKVNIPNQFEENVLKKISG
uniref:SCP domain-containing protein n=1 Tax=Strongyloides papillosus TaxID=174720 RepID=A0A0N5BLQ1_STREA